MKLPTQEEIKILRSFASRIDPNDPAAHNNLAVVYFNRGLYDEAISELKKALDIDPDFNIARINLEIILKKTKKREDLLEKYYRVVEKNPDDINSRLEFAKTLYQLGKYADALREYREVLSRESQNKEALKGMIKSYKKMGKFQEATAAIKRAQKILPDDVEISLDLAEVLYNQGNYDAAIKVLKEVISKDPKNAKAHLFLSFAYGEKGYLEEALEEALKAKELDPRISRIQGALGIEEEVPSVEELLQESIGVSEIKADPFESKLHLLKAYKNKFFIREARSILEELKRMEESRLELKKIEAELLILEEKWDSAISIIETIKEKDFHTWNMYAISLLRKGETEKARRILESIKNYPYALNNLGCLIANDDKEKAKDYFLRASQIEPGFIVPFYNLSLIAIEENDLEKALNYLKEINEIEKENPIYLTLYAKILGERGVKDKAIELLREALRIQPDFSFAATLLAEFSGEETQVKVDLKEYHVFQYLFSIEGSPRPIESRFFPYKKIPEFEGDKTLELKKVKILIKNRNFEEALKILIPLNKKYPDDSEIGYLIALVYENLSLYESAEQFYLKLLKEKEDDKIRFRLAHVFYRTKRYEKAEEEVNKILSKSKGYIDVLILKAKIKDKKGELEEALNILSEVFKRFKPNLKMIMWFAELLEKLGRYEEAIKEYERIIKEDRNNKEAIYSYALCSLKLKREGEFKRAIKELKDRGFKKHADLLEAIEFTMRGKYKEAIELFRSCERDLFLKEELHFYQGVCYALIGKYAKAIESWSKLIKLSENSPLAKKAKEYSNLALKWLKMLEREVKV
ncbi:MAG: tetratricopeptide repeat protein [Candidatus Hydrothermales bacterium]